MNKYIAIALLPFVLQGTIFCEDAYQDIDQMIMPELLQGRKLVGNEVPLELEKMLSALISYSTIGRYQNDRASSCLNGMLSQLKSYKDAEYKSTWANICKFFGSNPKKVVEEIDPAIKKITDAINSVNIVRTNFPTSTEKTIPLANNTQSDIYYTIQEYDNKNYIPTSNKNLKILKAGSTINIAPEKYLIFPTNEANGYCMYLSYNSTLSTGYNIKSQSKLINYKINKSEIDDNYNCSFNDKEGVAFCSRSLSFFSGPATIISDSSSPLGFDIVGTTKLN